MNPSSYPYNLNIVALLSPKGHSPIFDKILAVGLRRGHEYGEGALTLGWNGHGGDVAFESSKPSKLNVFFSENSYKAHGSPPCSLIVSIENEKSIRKIPYLAVVNSEESYQRVVNKYPNKPIVFIGSYETPTGTYAGDPSDLERILKETEVFIPEKNTIHALECGCVVDTNGVTVETLWDEIEKLLIPENPSITLISESTNAIGKLIVFGESKWAEHSLNITSTTSADLWNKAVLTYDADYYLPVIGDVNLSALKGISKILRDRPAGIIFGGESTINSALFDGAQILFSRSLWEEVGGFFEGCPRGLEISPFIVAALRNQANVVTVKETLFKTEINPSLTVTLFPDLFDLKTMIMAHEALKPTLNIEELTRIVKSFPSLMMPLFWLGLAYEQDGKLVEAAKAYMDSINSTINWQAMLRLQVVSTALAKEAESQGEIEIAKERYLAAEEFAQVAEQLLCEQDEILAPDWPRFPSVNKP